MRVFIVALLFFVLSSAAQAKDLTHRLGVGYANPFTIGAPAIAAQYYPDPNMLFSVALGVDTEKDASKFGLMGKLARVIFKEANLNFYMGAGAALISQEVAAVSDSGFELRGMAGVEYFFAGLDSLGFTFETGVGIASIGNGVRFRTFGDHPVNAGMIFYF